MSRILSEQIINIKKISKELCSVTIGSKYVSQDAAPGQFVNIKCCKGLEVLLRRPISICSVDKDKETFDIVFQLKGRGTELLSEKIVGDSVDFIGPLGNSFNISSKYRRIAVVGGGIGIFPLLYLLKETPDAHRHAYLGFRNQENAVLIDEFQAESEKLSISTDDGSMGYKGVITESLKKDINDEKFDIIYTCGPMPMIKEVAKISAQGGIKCQVSLEQRMGCGIGACLVCACKIGKPDNWEYKRVCKDGPVFWSDEVIFDD